VTRNEDGSLIIALAVILVLSGLSLAILARTVSALGSARLAQDSAAAVSAADTGVTDALYVLDHTSVTGSPITGGGPSFPFSWTASFTSPIDGTVVSTGTVNGRAHTVQVRVQRSVRWPWLLATSGSLVLDGTGTVATNDPSSPAVLAAGGQMVLRDGATGGSEQDLLGPGASCTGNGTTTLPASPCGAAVVLGSDVALPLPSAPPSPTLLTPCTGITALSGPATYLCQGPVSFGPGPVTIGPGQVDLYVEGAGGPASVSFAGATMSPAGGAVSFVVHVIGAGVIQPGDGAMAGSFTGVLDAPQATLSSNPCQFSLTGAADLASLDCVTGTGTGPVLTYDASLPGAYASSWQASSYGDATS
jgi:hypothetical protein